MKACLKMSCALLLLLSLSGLMQAQDNPTSVRQANSKVRISVDDVLGKWYSSDTINTFIEFVENGDFEVQIEGYRPGVGQYTFVRSNDSISANGTAPNWPPYDCTIRLLDDSTLMVMFYQYHYKTTRNVIFKRDK